MEIRFKAIVDTMREMAMIRFAQILGVFLILTSCGSGSSFNQIFVTSEDKKIELIHYFYRQKRLLIMAISMRPSKN